METSRDNPDRVDRARERRQEGSEASRAGWCREVGRPGAAVSRAARDVVAPLPPLSTATARFLQPRQPFWSPSTQEKCALRLSPAPLSTWSRQSGSGRDVTATDANSRETFTGVLKSQGLPNRRRLQ